MHSIQGPTEGVYWNHNGDFSGDVKLTVSKERVDGPWPVYHTYVIDIPFEDIKALVAEYVRDNAIAALENLSADELLNLIIDSED